DAPLFPRGRDDARTPSRRARDSRLGADARLHPRLARGAARLEPRRVDERLGLAGIRCGDGKESLDVEGRQPVGHPECGPRDPAVRRTDAPSGPRGAVESPLRPRASTRRRRPLGPRGRCRGAPAVDGGLREPTRPVLESVAPDDARHHRGPSHPSGSLWRKSSGRGRRRCARTNRAGASGATVRGVSERPRTRRAARQSRVRSRSAVDGNPEPRHRPLRPDADDTYPERPVQSVTRRGAHARELIRGGSRRRGDGRGIAGGWWWWRGISGLRLLGPREHRPLHGPTSEPLDQRGTGPGLLTAPYVPQKMSIGYLP